MKPMLILCIGLMTVFSSTGFAIDRPTQDSQYRLIKDQISSESIKVLNLGLFIEAYSQNHNGNLPSSWNELDTFASLTAFGNPPIQDRYALVPNTPTSNDLEGAQVLAIGNAASTDAIEEGRGRFIIYRTKNGEYLHGWYSEEKVQKIIAETHIVVPSPTVTPSSNSTSLNSTNGDTPENEITPIQSASHAPISSAPAIPTPQAQLSTETSTSMPLWVYGIIALSLGCIGGIWFLFLREKK